MIPLKQAVAVARGVKNRIRTFFIRMLVLRDNKKPIKVQKMPKNTFYGYTSEKHLHPINLKLTIPVYLEVLITNMMMKIPENSIFKVKTKKKNVFSFYVDKY